MSTQTVELDSNSTQIDQTLTQNLNNLTLNDSTGPTTNGWGWDQDEFDAKPEENKGYNETTTNGWGWDQDEFDAKPEENKGYNETTTNGWGWDQDEFDAKPEENKGCNETTNENWGWGEEKQKVEEDNALSFPIRNGVPDCTFYLKTGSCKFGSNCRFNHPVNVTRDKVKYRRGQENYQPGELNVNGASSVMFGQTNAEKTYNEKKWGDYSESNRQIDCKYYSTPGGCKYGSTCMFLHREKNDHPTELNFVGLPVRPGEKECAYYMNTGSCKYSTNCRYHHPEPTAVGAQAQSGAQNGRNRQHFSSPAPQNGGLHQPYALQTNQIGRPQQQYALSAHQNSGSQQSYALPAHQNGGLQQSYGTPAQMPVAPWSLHRNPNEAVPYANTSPSYATTGYYVPQQGVQSNPEWNGYQAPNQMHSTEMNKPRPPPLSYKMNNFAPTMGPGGEYPERPGQQECQYFMKTGDCKFKAACRYHHPKHRQQASEVMLSPAGLPLRPDQPLCVHFSRHGTCKFGRNCRYHHPADLSPPPAAYRAENDSFSYSEDVKSKINDGQVQESRW